MFLYTVFQWTASESPGFCNKYRLLSSMPRDPGSIFVGVSTRGHGFFFLSFLNPPANSD